MAKITKNDIRAIEESILRLIYDASDRPIYRTEVNRIFLDLFDVERVADAFVEYNARGAERIRVRLFSVANPERLYDILVAADDYGDGDFVTVQTMVALLHAIARRGGEYGKNREDEYYDKYKELLRSLRRDYSIKTRESIASMGNPLKQAKRILNKRGGNDFDDFDGYGRYRKKSKYSSFDDDYDDYETSDDYYDRILEGTDFISGKSRDKKSKKRKTYDRRSDDRDDDDDAAVDNIPPFTEVEEAEYRDDMLGELIDEVKALKKAVANSKPIIMGRPPVEAYTGEKPKMPAKSYEQRNSITADNVAVAENQRALNEIIASTKMNSDAINNVAKNIKVMSGQIKKQGDVLANVVDTVNAITDDLYGDDIDEDTDTDSPPSEGIQVLVPPTEGNITTIDDLVDRLNDKPADQGQSEQTETGSSINIQA